VRISKLVAVGIAGALFVSACGDDDDAGSATTAAPGSEGTTPDDGTQPAGTTGDPGTTAAPGGGEGTLRVWLNGPDTPEAVLDVAKAEFAKAHPDVTVEVERQEWDGIVDRLATVLPTGDSPDIFEVGNTQAQAFEAAGAMVDLTDAKEEIGGDDLLDSLVESGTYDGQFFGAPLYAGARIVVYRKDLFEASDLEVPTTMEEFVAAGKKLQEDNADVPNFSGIYFPGRNWQALLSFIWDAGGDIAVQEGEEWVGMLDSPESVAGLESVQDIMLTANQAPADSDDRNDFLDFCNGEIGMLMGPGWKIGQITGEDGCPGKYDDVLGAFALPGTDAAVAPTFLGGSNVGVSTSSENADLSTEFLAIMTSEAVQTGYAENGLIPVRKSLLDVIEGDEAAEAQAAAAEITRFVPASENWAQVEAGTILHDMGAAIAGGADVQEEATRANEAVVEILNS
jgi:ABC-type glycerol-3-phosphate transport system substrate-binding protein